MYYRKQDCFITIKICFIKRKKHQNLYSCRQVRPIDGKRDQRVLWVQLISILAMGRAAITSLFLRFVFFLKVCVLENIFVLISKKCPYFDLFPCFYFILGLEVLIPGTLIGQFE